MVVVVVVVFTRLFPGDERLRREATLPVRSPGRSTTAGVECPGEVDGHSDTIGRITPMVPPHTLPPKRGGGHR